MATGFWTIIFGYIVAFMFTMFFVAITIAFYYDRKADYKTRQRLLQDDVFADMHRFDK